jgi:hypothetical protein
VWLCRLFPLRFAGRFLFFGFRPVFDVRYTYEDGDEADEDGYDRQSAAKKSENVFLPGESGAYGRDGNYDSQD